MNRPPSTPLPPLPAGPSRVSVRGRATAVGGIAIVIWSTLAVLTTLARNVPPFQLLALAFSFAFVVFVGRALIAGTGVVHAFRLSPAVWVVGVGGLFGYHFCYVLALRLAPPAEANLVNYLWPLLIVLFSGMLPEAPLKARHLIGACSGFGGTALIVGRGVGLDFSIAGAPGYGLALAAAVLWAAYSVLSRRFAAISTDAVGAFCGITAALAAGCHLLLETSRPLSAEEWAVVLALGLGPVGSAFFFWDHGVKRGDLALLGTLAYAIPLMSTGLLVAFGFAEPSWSLAAAMALIVGGALIASGGLAAIRR